MGTPRPVELASVVDALERNGLLLESDAVFPSVTTIVVGGPVKGSWWGHPRGKTIFDVAVALHEHPDVLVAKLVDRKVTYVHRELWRPLIAVGRARASWQMAGLAASASELLERVSRTGKVRTDEGGNGAPGVRAAAAAAAAARARRALTQGAGELERRLLVHAESIHTDAGSHARLLESWEHWMRRRRFALGAMDVDAARSRLEAAVGAINEATKACATLPWAARDAKPTRKRRPAARRSR